jgi:hypothetical protein
MVLVVKLNDVVREITLLAKVHITIAVRQFKNSLLKTVSLKARDHHDG